MTPLMVRNTLAVAAVAIGIPLQRGRVPTIVAYAASADTGLASTIAPCRAVLRTAGHRGARRFAATVAENMVWRSTGAADTLSKGRVVDSVSARADTFALVVAGGLVEALGLALRVSARDLDDLLGVVGLVVVVHADASIALEAGARRTLAAREGAVVGLEGICLALALTVGLARRIVATGGAAEVLVLLEVLVGIAVARLVAVLELVAILAVWNAGASGDLVLV
jgi:hypothetical protein